MMCNNPKLDLVNMIEYIKFGEILSICSQDIERKRIAGRKQTSGRTKMHSNEAILFFL